MGILLSFIRYLCSETDYQENERIRNPNTGEKLEYARGNNFLDSIHQWHNGKYLTISVPNLRYSSSSLARTSVNDKVIKSSVVFIEENTPQNVCCRERKLLGRRKGEEKDIQKEPVMVNCKPERRWIKHYSDDHRILVVGEGDFSFSTCLAKAFVRAPNMIATSLDSQAFLVSNYKKALFNIVELSMRNCKVMHEIDATRMANHIFLGGIKFDRIIFNFPFAGFFKNLSRDSQLRRHRTLVSLFLKNAKEMLSENGEIHITHKTNGFHFEWNLESMAYSQRLRLIEAVDFNLLDYPGYNTKCGFGGDNNFNCHPSKTYKFGLKC